MNGEDAEEDDGKLVQSILFSFLTFRVKAQKSTTGNNQSYIHIYFECIYLYEYTPEYLVCFFVVVILQNDGFRSIRLLYAFTLSMLYCTTPDGNICDMFLPNVSFVRNRRIEYMRLR